jgi:hypothetical protein
MYCYELQIARAIRKLLSYLYKLTTFFNIQIFHQMLFFWNIFNPFYTFHLEIDLPCPISSFSGENLILVTINRDDNRRNLVEITSTYQQRRWA